MLLTSRPARSPLTHLERVKFTPPHDAYPSIRLRSPVNVNLPSDGNSLVSPISVPTPAPPKSPYDLQQPTRSVPLRVITDVPKQTPAKFEGQLMGPHLDAIGVETANFSRIRRRNSNLSVPKRVRFQGVEIISFSPISPTSPALPRFEEVHGPSGSLGIHVQGNLPTISIFSEENTSFHSEHIDVCPAPDHETSAVDEFPDSPSVYSPTPPNSSDPPTFDFSERGLPNLVEVDWVVTSTGNDQSSGGRFSGDGPSNELHNSGRSCGKDRSLSISKDVSDVVTDERAPAFRHDNLTEASSWWGHVSAVVAMLSAQNMWGKRANSVADEFASIR